MPDPLARLRRRFAALCKKVGVNCRFLVTPQHDGTAHVEVADGVFYFVVTERGAELQRRSTTSEEVLLYWLACDAAFEAASEFERKHRQSGTSFRRLMFEKEIEFMTRFRPAWGGRKRAEIEVILTKYPYDDRPEG